jgi:hypothetical protein
VNPMTNTQLVVLIIAIWIIAAMAVSASSPY